MVMDTLLRIANSVLLLFKKVSNNRRFFHLPSNRKLCRLNS